MKIAILISGEPRFWQELDQLIENLKGYTEVDWFFYLWKNSPYGTNLGYVSNSWNNITEDVAYNKIKNNLPTNHNIAQIVIDEQENYTFPEITGSMQWGVQPNRSFTQFLGIHKVDQLRQQYSKKYDIVIKARGDVGLVDPVDLHDIKRILEEKHKTIIVPSNYPDWGTKCLLNDKIVMALPEIMDIYTNLFNMAKSYDNIGLQWGGESMIIHHMNVNNIRFTHNNFRMTELDRQQPCIFGRWK